MSFSSELKKELSLVFDRPRHCRIAELGAVISYLGKVSEDGTGITVSSDNILPVSVCAELIRKITGVMLPVTENGRTYSLVIDDSPEMTGLLQAVKLIPGERREGLRIRDAHTADLSILTGRKCCKCAFLRGAFLAAGTISDPDRFYSLEFLCRTDEQAETLQSVLSGLADPAKTVRRQRYRVLYVKDSDRISDLLGFMGARISLLELENTRIIRGTRGNVNRRVNCETANIGKTARASAVQIEAIKKIERTIGLAALPDGLDEMARIRLEYPAATLQELGQMLETPVGKSGVNHRLRKIVAISRSI